MPGPGCLVAPGVFGAFDSDLARKWRWDRPREVDSEPREVWALGDPVPEVRDLKEHFTFHPGGSGSGEEGCGVDARVFQALFEDGDELLPFEGEVFVALPSEEADDGFLEADLFLEFRGELLGHVLWVHLGRRGAIGHFRPKGPRARCRFEGMSKSCSACGSETRYPNGLCGPCFNMGIRGVVAEGVIFSLSSFASWAEKTPLGRELGEEWLERVRCRVREKKPRDREDCPTLWERLGES